MFTKRFFMIFFMVVAIAQQVQSQNIKPSNVPAEVLAAFKKKHLMVNKVSWSKEGENYEASFISYDHHMSVLYDAKGNMLETESEIKPEHLPVAIKNYIQENFRQKKIKQATSISYANGTSKYKVKIGGKVYLFDENGNLEN